MGVPFLPMSSTTIDRPPTQVVLPDALSRPRRRPRWVALILAVLLIASGVGSYVFLMHYEPLQQVGGGFSGTATRVDATAVSTGYLRIPYRENGAFALSVLLWNYGRFPVTIEDPGLIPQRAELSFFHTIAVDVFLSPNDAAVPFDSGALTPFHAVTIEPSTGVYLVYRGRLRGCRDFALGTSIGYDGIAMRTRTLFVDHTFVLPLDQPLLFEAPATCPE